jgi:hypothetical protein
VKTGQEYFPVEFKRTFPLERQKKNKHKKKSRLFMKAGAQTATTSHNFF